jgi:hypothetical protein
LVPLLFSSPLHARAESALTPQASKQLDLKMEMDVDASSLTQSAVRLVVKCRRCGLAVDRLIEGDRAQTEIDMLAYTKTCQAAPERAAFDFDCPELQASIRAGVANESELRVV